MSLECEKNGRVLLSCDRKGTYRNGNAKIQDKRGARSIGIKKYGCSFLLKDKELPNAAEWVLMVVCDIHNHYQTENLEGHSFTGRLSEEEEKLVVDLSKTLVRPKDILNTLK